MTLRDDARLGVAAQTLDGLQPHPQGVGLAGPVNLTEVDIRRQHRQAHAPGFGHIGKGAVETALVADHRGH
ncbi:MAG: hypothetical protein PVF25_18935, partial [Desulfobacterales bacterium]